MTGVSGGTEEPRSQAGSGYLAQRGRSRPSPLSEINVTPFVDVMLVLLVIFMITAPMMIRAMDVNLPVAGLRQDQATERVIVTLQKDGRTYLDDQAVHPELLEDRLREVVETRGLRLAYLRADADLLYRQVIAIMDLMKAAGVDTIGLEYIYPEEKRAR
jgi:biopolymer transport protein TolR